MKATIEIPDELYRRVKAKSALEGRTVREVTTELFSSWLEHEDNSRHEKSVATVGELMADACGIVASGVGDLSTNSKHLDGFGDARSRDR